MWFRLENNLNLIDYVIIGTGKDYYPLEESMFKRLKDKGIKVDVIPTVNSR